MYPEKYPQNGVDLESLLLIYCGIITEKASKCSGLLDCNGHG